MRIFNELRYPSSNLSEIFTQRMFQASFEKIWKIFFELSRGQAWSYGRTDRQTDGQTDRQTDRRTDAGNDNTPPALGPRGKNGYVIGCKFLSTRTGNTSVLYPAQEFLCSNCFSILYNLDNWWVCGQDSHRTNGDTSLAERQTHWKVIFFSKCKRCSIV